MGFGDTLQEVTFMGEQSFGLAVEVSHPTKLSLAEDTWAWVGYRPAGLHINPSLPEVKLRMLNELSTMRRGPKERGKTGAPGKQQQALVPAVLLPGEGVLATTTTTASSPRHCCADGDHAGASALAFPCESSLGKQEEEKDLPRVPGVSSRPFLP